MEPRLLTDKMDEPNSEFRQFLAKWRKEHGYEETDYVDIPPEDICKAQRDLTKKQILEALETCLNKYGDVMKLVCYYKVIKSLKEEL